MKVGDYFKFVRNLEALANMDIIGYSYDGPSSYPRQDWIITRINNDKVFFRLIYAAPQAESSLQKSMFNKSTEQIFPTFRIQPGPKNQHAFSLEIRGFLHQ